MRTTSASISRLRAVEDGPVGTAQAREQGAPDQLHGPSELAGVVPVASDAKRSTSVVTESPRRRVDATRQVGSAVGVPPQSAAGVGGGRVRGGQRHGTLGPDRQGPLAVTDALAVEGQVDDELRAADRWNGPAAPWTATGPRTATSTASLVTPGNGRQTRLYVGAEGFEPSLGTV